MTAIPTSPAESPATPNNGDQVEDPAAQVLDRCRELVEDLSLSEVQRWKERHPGQLAVGYMPIYVPRPLLEAIGCLPVALFGGGDQVEIIRGDSIFQSYICHIPRSTVELGLRGHLDALSPGGCRPRRPISRRGPAPSCRPPSMRRCSKS